MDNSEGLKLLRAPFPPNQISYLPKGGVKLAYVGHAALTDRLLDADPAWVWEPLALHKDTGLPMLDEHGGLWIRLTVCGITRLGYGDAGAKQGPNAIKEAIGDALRNAAMRFGAALDLWHKGDLHADTMPERELLDWTAAIDSAGTVGELKRITEDAETAARGYGDAEALAAILRAAEAKAAKAKK